MGSSSTQIVYSLVGRLLIYVGAERVSSRAARRPDGTGKPRGGGTASG